MKLTIEEDARNYILKKTDDATVTIGLFKPGTC